MLDSNMGIQPEHNVLYFLKKKEVQSKQFEKGGYKNQRQNYFYFVIYYAFK